MNVNGSHNVDVFVPYAPAFLSFFFCKYWPDGGPLRQKLVANNIITIKYYTVVSDGVNI